MFVIFPNKLRGVKLWIFLICLWKVLVFELVFPGHFQWDCTPQQHLVSCGMDHTWSCMAWLWALSLSNHMHTWHCPGWMRECASKSASESQHSLQCSSSANWLTSAPTSNYLTLHRGHKSHTNRTTTTKLNQLRKSTNCIITLPNYHHISTNHSRKKHTLQPVADKKKK